GDGTRRRVRERGGEPDADGRLPFLVEVGGRLEQLAEDDLDPRLLACLATGGIAHVLAPFDEAAREAPLACPELPGTPPDEEHSPRGVAHHHRRADTGIREEDEAAGGAGRPGLTAALRSPQRPAAARAPAPVVAQRRHD